MLFQFSPEALTAPARSRRIRCLERHIRQTSEGRYKVQDYLEWLDTDKIPIPSRQTLHDDMAFYSALCDDVDYGAGSKWLHVNPAIGRDVVRWFMGGGWETLIVRPRLSSSVARCLLMAQKEDREVQFLYSKLEQLGQGISRAETWRVIPHHIVPGLDSAYLSMRLHSGRLATFNLARIIGRVTQTGQGGARYQPIQEEGIQSYRIDCPDSNIVTQLRAQYQGLTVLGSHQLSTSVDPPTQHFLAEMLQGWILRTAKRKGASGVTPLTWTLLTKEENDG